MSHSIGRIQFFCYCCNDLLEAIDQRRNIPRNIFIHAATISSCDGKRKLGDPNGMN